MPRPIPPAPEIPPPALPLRVAGDVHLCPEEPEVVDAFVAFLERLEGTGGTLVLLGDIFDLWVGKPHQDDPVPSRVLAVLKRLKDAGTHVVYMLGNRDIGFRGVDAVELELWPDPVVTTLGDRRVLFTHGDQLCTADHGYQGMRRFLHGPGGRALEHGLPFKIRRWLGEGTRRLSMRETGKKPRADMGLDYGEALRWMDELRADAIVAGHVHTGVHHRHAGPPAREILVLKDWERGGSVITFDGETLAQVRP